VSKAGRVGQLESTEHSDREASGSFYAEGKEQGRGGGRGTVADLFGGDGDLAGLLVSLLPDEPHHLLDLLGDIGVVHLGGGSGPPAKPISQATTTRGEALVQEREGGNRESTGMVEVDVEDVVEQV
jgi:hypothetical protein